MNVRFVEMLLALSLSFPAAVTAENLFTMDPVERELLRQEFANCEVITGHIRRCYFDPSWLRTFSDSNAVAQFDSTIEFEQGIPYGARVVSQDKAVKGEIGLETIIEELLDQITRIAEENSGTISILAEEARVTNGEKSYLLAYRADMNGVPVIFVTSIFEFFGVIEQFVTWRVGAELHRFDYEVHMSFMSQWKFYP